MCNYLHGDSVPIKKTGYGWKLVLEDHDGVLYSFVSHTSYKYQPDGIIFWYDEQDGDGFCFFPKKPTKKEISFTMHCATKQDPIGKPQI